MRGATRSAGWKEGKIVWSSYSMEEWEQGLTLLYPSLPNIRQSFLALKGLELFDRKK